MLKIAVFLLFAAHVAHGEDYMAQCDVVKNPEFTGDDDVKGTVIFTQTDVGDLTVKVDLTGFKTTSEATDHGFHIHQSSENIDQDCANAGSHFNPANVEHGGPDDAVRHVGDFGNIEVTAAGTSKVTFTDSMAKLNGANSIIGKSIVVHEDPDDLGKGGEDDSLTTGHAGARLGCCVIKQVEDDDTGSAPSISGYVFTTLLLSIVVLWLF